ncbi:hypothetical protein HY483_01180 [Candidatus Woesearchaeota archaeon]|nr:hypothetical protein [Candidatus Woesearchaeota archaeon]
MKTYLKLIGAIGLYMAALHPVYERGWNAAMEFSSVQNAQGQDVKAVPVVERNGEIFVVDYKHRKLRKIESTPSVLERIIDHSDKFFANILPEADFE